KPKGNALPADRPAWLRQSGWWSGQDGAPHLAGRRPRALLRGAGRDPRPAWAARHPGNRRAAQAIRHGAGLAAQHLTVPGDSIPSVRSISRCLTALGAAKSAPRVPQLRAADGPKTGRLYSPNLSVASIQRSSSVMPSRRLLGSTSTG